MINAYISAFNRAYPQKKCDVKPAFNKQHEQIGWRVAIDGDYGNMILSNDDMRVAISNFLR